MSKTVFKLRSIRSKNDLGKAHIYSRMNVLSDTHMTVLTELRFIVSLWTISTGRIFAGSDPRALGSTAHQISPLSITNQLFRERQVGIAEGHHQVLREFRRTHHPAPSSREPPHNSDHEANQARYRSCCHRKYLIQRFAYPNSTANKGVCQIRCTMHLFYNRRENQ